MENNKIKIFKKLTAFVLAGTMAVAFTGCGKKKEPLLSGTILENTEIVYVDDQPLIMRFYSTKHNECNGKHYQDIVSSRIYHIKNENNNGSDVCLYCDVISLDAETKREAITPYLTSKEIGKANDGTFTDDDAIVIEQRIVNESKTLK